MSFFSRFCLTLSVFAVSCIFFSPLVDARVVSRDKAEQFAQDFWSQGPDTKSASSSIVFAWDSRFLDSEAGMQGSGASVSCEPLYYVFHGSDGRGFLIVSADDVVKPVLAYSFSDRVPSPDNLPDGMKLWLANISEQIALVRQNGVENSNAAQQWSERSAAGEPIVEMATPKWSQDEPYNYDCPYDGEYRSVTGCTATALGIMMRYFEWPDRGVGSTDAYTTPSMGISVESRDLEQDYDWDNMPLHSNEEKEYTEAEKAAVGRLLADIGASVKMDYSYQASGAWPMPDVLYSMFKYSANTCFISKDSTDDDAWVTILKNNLDKMRPVTYMAYNQDLFGHSFIIDGYSSDDYFHVNWGWGGYYDGYFTLDNLTPYEGLTLSIYHNAIFNCYPDYGDDTMYEWIQAYSAGIDYKGEEIIKNEPFTIDSFGFANFSMKPFSGLICAALTDSEGEIKEIVSDEIQLFIDSGHYSGMSDIDCLITENIEVGDKLRFFYKSDGGNQWETVFGYSKGCVWEIELRKIKDVTSMVFDKTNETVSIITGPGIAYTFLSDNGSTVASGFSADDGSILIDVSGLPRQKYVLTLGSGPAALEINIILNSK